MAAVYGEFETAFGRVGASLDSGGRLTSLTFRPDVAPGSVRDDSAVGPGKKQIDEFFASRRTDFDLELAPPGTAFQKSVWAALRGIPKGQTRSYGQLALQLGIPGAARAVGRANATNPIALIVPCHRVIGADGSLTGYAGGLDLKRRLLQFEEQPGLWGSLG